MTDDKFIPMSKIPRLRRDIIITEKIDGTNASVHIDESGNVRAASRTRWITPEDDNFGFAAWVRDNEHELRLLGPGHHFGEWWGSGIQRGYGLRQGKRRFSLFNVGRWLEDPSPFVGGVAGINVRVVLLPAVCAVVPRLWQGSWDDFVHHDVLRGVLTTLRECGSHAAPFMNPEGVVVYHTAGNHSYKVTLDDDDVAKSQAKAAA